MEAWGREEAAGRAGPTPGLGFSSSHTIGVVLPTAWMATRERGHPPGLGRSSDQSTDMGGVEREEGAVDGLQEAAGDCVQQG